MRSVTLDYANMLSPNLGGRGLNPLELEGDLSGAFRQAFDGGYQDVQVGEGIVVQ